MKHYIFADESNLNSRYLLIGGIWVDEPTYKAVVDECNNFKTSIGWTLDAKFNWINVSKLTLPRYKNFIDIFFKYNLKFNAIIIDQNEISLKDNHENNFELGFYKFYFHLLWYNSLKDNKTEYYIFLDRRNNKKTTRLDDLKTFLTQPRFKDRFKLAFNENLKDVNPYGLNIMLLEPVNSKHYNLIQFSDILLGAFGYHYNNRQNNPDSSMIKNELAQHIAQKIKVKTLKFNTNNKGYKNINIWKFKPSKIKSAL